MSTLCSSNFHELEGASSSSSFSGVIEKNLIYLQEGQGKTYLIIFYLFVLSFKIILFLSLSARAFMTDPS